MTVKEFPTTNKYIPAKLNNLSPMVMLSYLTQQIYQMKVEINYTHWRKIICKYYMTNEGYLQETCGNHLYLIKRIRVW